MSDVSGPTSEASSGSSERTRFASTSIRMLQAIALVALAYVAVFVAICFYSLTPGVRSLLAKQDRVMAAQLQGMERIPDLANRIQSLDDQIKLVTSKSIDGRVRTLEEVYKTGRLKPADVIAMGDLRLRLDTIGLPPICWTLS